MTGEDISTLASAPAEPRVLAPKGNLARDILAVFFHPTSLFRELPRANRMAGALLLLMLVYALYGLGLISTGVLDYEIGVNAQTEISRVRQNPPGKDESEKFASSLDTVEKGAVFQKALQRVLLLAGGPLLLCLSVSVLSALLFLVVSLRGGKANFQMLLGVTVFAAYVEAPRLLLRLFLIAQLHVSRVETSAAAFFSRPEIGLGNYLFLRRLDPFEVWYYVLVGLGVYQTGQLTRRSAIITVCVLALLAAALHTAVDLSELATLPAVSFGNS